MGLNKPNTILFRASAAHKLMQGNNGITENQLAEIAKLEKRRDDAKLGKAKPLTPNMKAKLKELIAKRDAPPRLGDSAKGLIKEMWLAKNFGYRDILVTDELMKGHLCEQDSMELVSNVWPCDEFRRKNQTRWYNDYFTGECDVHLETSEIIEDMKSCWDLKSFFRIRKLNMDYYGQGQVYMDLAHSQGFNVQDYRVHYCLNNTPKVIVDKLCNLLLRKFGGNEENPEFIKAKKQLIKNHTFDHIPEKQRVKTFEFKYDPDYISELKKRVIQGRAYYNALTL